MSEVELSEGVARAPGVGDKHLAAGTLPVQRSKVNGNVPVASHVPSHRNIAKAA